MALRVAQTQQSGRYRANSRGLNADEEASDIASLVRELAFSRDTPENDENTRLSETAEKLRLQLTEHTPSKDTFRRAGGFEKLLGVLGADNLRRGGLRGANDLIRSILRLLSEAINQHNGNERYFHGRLDGWKSLHHCFESATRSEDADLDLKVTTENVTSLFNILTAFALGKSDVDIASAQVGSIENPHGLSIALRLSLRSLDSPPVSEIVARVLKLVAELVQFSTRNTILVWQTGVLSELLAAALNKSTPSVSKEQIQSIVLSLGRFGLDNLDDVALLFDRAAESDGAKTILLHLLRTSKEPAFVQFDLRPGGHSSIEVPTLRAFPPANGYSLAAWVRFDEFDKGSHTTLFGAFDPNKTCFILMYLEKDSHQLILQTSIRASNPSVRFKSTRFEISKWYHVAVVQRRNASDSSQSVASLFINGSFTEQRKCNYPESPEAPGQTPSISRSRPVQAFFGTPRNVAMDPTPDAVKTRWSLANAHVYQTALSDEFVAVHYRLGPRYRGNLQDCLGPLLTYQASAELNRHNETMHPEKSDKSDIITATEGRGSDVVPESRLILAICPTSVIDFSTTDNKARDIKQELDPKALAKYRQLAQHARAIAVNTAIPSLNEAISRSYGTGVLFGDPVVVVPQPLDHASWRLAGSLPVLLRLLETASTQKSFLQAVEIFFECVKDSWRISEAMEKGQGFGVLAMVIREKLGLETNSLSSLANRRPAPMLSLEERQALPFELLGLVLEFVGYNKKHTESSMLVNPMAYRVLLIDFDTWRRCDLETQTLYYSQFRHFTVGNRNAAFNQKRLSRMRVVKRLIEALKHEDLGQEAAKLMMTSLKALLDTGSASSHRDIAMLVAYGLHDDRAMPAATVRSVAFTAGVLQKVSSWPRSSRGSRPSTPNVPTSSQLKPGLPRYELSVLVLRLLAEALHDERSASSIRRFCRAVPNRWLLHLFAENDVRVIELTLCIVSKAMSALGPEFKTPFIDKNGGFTILKYRLKPFWRSKSVWILVFAIFFGRSFPLEWLEAEFSAFHLVEMLSVDNALSIKHPEMLPTIIAMLEAGLRKVAQDEVADPTDSTILKNVIQFLGELYNRSPAFHEFASNSRYLQEILFVLFPLLVGSDRLAAETELQSEALSFKGEEVTMRPHSNSVGERPPSVRSLDMTNGKRTPSPMAPNRVEAPKRISSFVLVNNGDNRLTVPPTQFTAPMAPKSAEPVKINITNSLVESLLELAVTLFIDQVCDRDKYTGIGLFLKVPPAFREHQAYFESYVLVNALSQLGSHLRLNQRLLLETRVLTNLARYAQHMAEAVSEGWFIDGAQPLLDFTGEILEHLQQPEVANVKSVRLCSQSTNSIRVVFLKATLWRLAELDEDASEKNVGEFLIKMTYWQTILFSAENQEALFTKLICFLLYHKLVSNVESVRLASARLWRMVLMQKPTETATLLANTMGPEQRHLSTGFMKLIAMDDEDFIAWIDANRIVLDTVFHASLSKLWEEFVSSENRSSEETTRTRLSKRRERLRQWAVDETMADDFMHKYEVSTNHWRANVHAQERVRLQRALQDHQENVNHLQQAFARLDKLLHQPCGLEHEAHTDLRPARWQLDETEAVNRMRMRIVPDSSEVKEAFLPKRKASRRLTGGKLAVNTHIVRVMSDDIDSPLPPTPGIIPPTPLATDGSTKQNVSQRARSDSTSNSQLLEGGFEMVDDPKEDEDGLIEDKNRKVMTSLQRGDMVQQLHNISRIVGLEACEGLVVVGQKCLYLQDNFFQRSDGEIVSVSQAPEDERDPYVQLISGKDVGSAQTKHSVGDQETKHWTWAEVLSISKRRFLLRDVAIEVFFTDGRSYLLTCMSSKARDELYTAIVNRAPHIHSTSAVAREDAWRLDTLRTPEDVPQKFGAKFGNFFNPGPTHVATKKWQRGEMSNFQYLMLVNTMAGRTFNDLTQYPVFPWVLSDYSSEELDLDNPKSFRDFSKPMGCQSAAREAEYKDRFKQFAEMGDNPPFHYGTHYSSAMIVSSFLIRLQPFVQSYLLLQGGAFDHADRLFDSVERAWQSASRDTMSDVRELTPEFFYLPEFLTNINKYDFGTKQVTGEVVDDVHLPKWAKGDPHIFIAKHREALESQYVSDHLNEWIDLVFGFKQRGEAAIEATNVFQHLSYGGARDLDKIDDQVERLATIGIIHSFGQTPHQVFQKMHAYRELEKQAEPKLDTLAESLTRLPDTIFNIHERVADFNLITSPAQSLDNRLLASGPCKLNLLPNCTRYMQWGFTDHSIRFFSKHSGRLLGLYENTHVGAITTAIFVDSKTLVTAGADCTIGVWNVVCGKDLVEISPTTHLFGHRTAVTVLAASRVFSTLLSISSDGQVLIWGLNRQNCIRVLLQAGGSPIQAARMSNVSGHILLLRGPSALLYTLNGHLLVEQKLSDREDDDILSAAFYEGAGGEYLERELIFTGHACGATNVWALTTLSDGSWYLQLVKRLQQNDGNEGMGRAPAGITSVLPVSRAVYTGDEEGNVWQWETVLRHSSFSGSRR